MFQLVEIIDSHECVENEQPLHTWNKFHLVVVYNSFCTLLDWIGLYFVKGFCF